MNKLININSISGSNDYKKFLENLYEKLNQYSSYNKNLLQVIDEEIKQNKQAYKKRDGLKVSSDQSFYSTDIADHIIQFIKNEDLRQSSRQKLYIVSLISSMCEQDEMLGYQIKNQKSFDFESILRWILDAWSFDPEDEEIEEMEEKDQLQQEQYKQKDNLTLRRDKQDNTAILESISQQNILQVGQNYDYQKNQFQQLISREEILQELRSKLEEDKKNSCLKFSCQILGGLDIKSFHIILEYLNKKMTNLMEDEIDQNIKQNKNSQNQDLNNKNVTIIQGQSQTQNIVQSNEQQNKLSPKNSEAKIQSEKMLNEQDPQIENIDQNSSYYSNNIINSQSNLSQSQFVDNSSSNRKMQNNAFQIDCILQIIKHLEEDRIINKHVDQCLLFGQNSQLRIEKLRKGISDFQIVIGFKITFKRQKPFILFQITTEKNQTNEQLIQAIVNVNYDNQKTNIKIILQEKKTEYKNYILDLGLTEQLLHKWISFQIVFQPQSKEQVIDKDYEFIIFIICTLAYNKEKSIELKKIMYDIFIF